MRYDYIAVDFDGTLCEHKFPHIGSPIPEMIAYIKARHEEGTKIILHTCRDNEYLTMAVDWCRELGVPIDAVNENPWVQYSDKKIYADIYIDDRAVNVKEVINKMTAEEYITEELKALKEENAQLLSDFLKEKEVADLFRKLLHFKAGDKGEGGYYIGTYGYIWEGDEEYGRIKNTVLSD